MKWCPRCERNRRNSSFYTTKTKTGSRLAGYCKSCRNALNRPKSIERYNNLSEEQRVQRRRRLKNNALVHKFNITLADYEQMLAVQEGKCAVCGQPETALDKGGPAIRQLAVDHNHTTQHVRGLLCYRCNTTLGHVDESPELLRALLAYIDRHNGPTLSGLR